MTVTKIAPDKLFTLAVAAAALAVVWHEAWPGEVPRPRTMEVVLPAEPSVTLRRLRAKDRIAQEVIGGRRTLLEAAALFGVLNGAPPRLTNLSCLEAVAVCRPIPGRTADEQLCRQVVAWTDACAARGPLGQPGASAVVARLYGEFWAALRSGGEIRLPDPAGLPSAPELLALAEESPPAAQPPASSGSEPGVTDVQ
jgi:hypothetical protein